jgi:DNA-binding ferritin-like protein
MNKQVVNLLKLQNQLRICHWQANLYGEHKALGKAYEALDSLIDDVVEVHQGKYGKIIYNTPVDLGLVNKQDIDIPAILEEFTDYLVTGYTEGLDPVKDSDCLNIRDEIMAVVNRLKYLLTLK